MSTLRAVRKLRADPIRKDAHAQVFSKRRPWSPLARIFPRVIRSLEGMVISVAQSLMRWFVLINESIKLQMARLFLFFNQSLKPNLAQTIPREPRKMFGSLINPAKVSNCFEYSFQASLRRGMQGNKND